MYTLMWVSMKGDGDIGKEDLISQCQMTRRRCSFRATLLRISNISQETGYSTTSRDTAGAPIRDDAHSSNDVLA